MPAFTSKCFFTPSSTKMQRISSIVKLGLGASSRNNALRNVYPQAAWTRRCQSSLHPDQQREAQFIPTPVYEFHGVSSKDMLLAEMRHHDVAFTEIAGFFEVHPTVVFFGYIGVGSKTLRHGWSSRMTEQDILFYVRNTKAGDL